MDLNNHLRRGSFVVAEWNGVEVRGVYLRTDMIEGISCLMVGVLHPPIPYPCDKLIRTIPSRELEGEDRRCYEYWNSFDMDMFDKITEGPFIGQFVEATVATTGQGGTIIGIFTGRVPTDIGSHIVVVSASDRQPVVCERVTGLFHDENLSVENAQFMWDWRNANKWWRHMYESEKEISI